MHLEVALSNHDDALFISSTPVGSDLTLHTGSEREPRPEPVQRRGQHRGPSAAETTLFLGGGNDVVRVNYDELGRPTQANGTGGLLTLHGENGSDLYEIGLSGTASPAGPQTLIEVFDNSSPLPNGDPDPGVNQLRIFGTDDRDVFLFRATDSVLFPRVGMVAAYQGTTCASPTCISERVNYDGGINGGVQVFGGDGNDTFVMDDNLAPTTIFGDAGNDTFQVGQVFQSARDGSNPDNGLDPFDFFHTTLTTRGYLSNGVSETTTLFGGTGNDSFTIYRNLAELFLFGEEDDDTFLRPRVRQCQPGRPGGAVREPERRPGRRLHLLQR